MHNKAINKYKKAEAAYNQEKSPTEIVASLLNELTRSMGLVAQNIETEISTKENKSAQDKSKHFTRALVAIYSLQTSLDFDEGGSLATQLFQLYEYCRQQLIKGFSRRVTEGIKKAIQALNEIASAWDSLISA